MPSPVSVTVTVTLIASTIADTVTVPSGGVCRTAFSSRLVNSRVSSEPLPDTMSAGSRDSSRMPGRSGRDTASAASSSASIRHTGPTSRANLPASARARKSSSSTIRLCRPAAVSIAARNSR